MNKIKIVHFADFHLGIEKGPLDAETRISGRILDFLDSLDSMVDFVEDEKVDLVVFAGDAFHTSSPNQTHVNMFAQRIQRLSRLCKVVLVPGNHDMPGPLHKNTSVDIFGSLAVDNVYLGDTYGTLLLDLNGEALQVTTFPYPTRHIVTKKGKPLIDKEEYPKRVAEIIGELRSEVDITIPAIFVGHFSVTGSKYGSERKMIVGTEAEVDVMDLLNWTPGDGPIICIWDYFALGHIHYHQEVFDDPPVVYSGSLERVDFGEENQDKGFVYIEIEEKEGEKGSDKIVTWEFVDVDARPMVTIEIDVAGKKSIRKLIAAELDKYDLEDTIVRITIHTDDNSAGTADAVYRMLSKRGVYYVSSFSLKITDTRTTRFNLEKPISEHDEEELLELYFQGNDVDGEELDDIIDIAFDIIEEVEND